MKARRVLLPALCALAAGACETSVPRGEPDAGEVLYNPVERVGERPGAAAEIAAMLEGAWSNADQYAFAPDDLKRPPAPGHPYDWLDLQHATFHQVAAPAVGEHVVYLEWRGGGPHGDISRQRLWALREGEDGALAGMDFYTFADPGPYAGRGAAPGAFEDLTPDDLVGYPEGCTLAARRPAWRGYVLDLSPQTCTITTRSGRTMSLEADIEIAPDHLTYREAGRLEDGRYAFLVPGGPAYRFRRAK